MIKLFLGFGILSIIWGIAVVAVLLTAEWDEYKRREVVTMPVTVRKRGEKYRVVEADSGRIAKNKGGTAIDGGGHHTRNRAERQARAVNHSLHNRK